MADVDSTAPALRLLACGPRSVGIDDPTATGGASMVPANIFKTRGHPLARRHWDWGVAFVGTKAELQAAGFGAGAVFPGEPGGNKKKTALPACNGFPRIEVELYGHCTYLGEPSQTELQNYVVHARYLAEKFNEKREFSPSRWPGVKVHHSSWYDVYKGSMEDLVAAGLSTVWQFPGQPGCGKVCTTFSPDGKRVTAGANTARQEGSRAVMVAGKQYEVRIWVNEAERGMRHARWRADSDARLARARQDVAALLLQHQTQPPRPQLRLVWSA